MKITNLRTAMVSVPIRKVKSPVHDDFQTLGCVLVFVDTDEGVTGEGILFGIGTKRLTALNSMVLSLKVDLLEEDPHCTERIWRKLWRQVNFFGFKGGMSLFAMAAVDVACWDIVGKKAGQPLYKVWGAFRDEAPAYASGGLRLVQTVEELVEEARDFLARGFRAMKLRLGFPRMEEDVERVRAVRQAVGPDTGLMVDAHQAFTVDQAIRLGRKLEEFNLVWFEEPVPAHDLKGAARVAAALDLPIALGENEYNRYGFQEILERKAADVLTPSLTRVGITEFRKVAHMAEAYEVPISPHVFPEQSMHMVASIPNGLYAEYMPWFSSLYREKMELRDGKVVLPDRPGLGFTFDPSVIERYRFQG